MFDLFKSRPRDVKEIRNELLRFIKEQLQRNEGGEGSNITGLYLFFNCSAEERHLYEAAVYNEAPGRFRDEEIQKIADDYAISLPPSWVLEITFGQELPPEAIRCKDLDAALLVSTTGKRVLSKEATAYINVLNGSAEKEKYAISSTRGKFNIGRGASVQTPDGFFRKNFIAFKDSDEKNRAVSRQHAHIEWDPDSGAFFLFADDGGVPPGNKIKVRTTGGAPVKLMTTKLGHRLQEGDQVILGESAVLEFSYLAD